MVNEEETRYTPAMERKRIVIDTDCGVDDAIAIMICFASPEVEVLGITTVAGNVGLDHVVDNVLRLLTFTGRQRVPVYRGASRPLVAAVKGAEDIHGANGFGNVIIPEARARERAERAPQALHALAQAHPGLTLLTLGPLTNVAMALSLYPDLPRFIGEIVAMGGAIETGNVTPRAEFNFYADPEAVQIVLDTRIPLSLLTWDATLTCVHTEEELTAAGFGSTASGRLFLDLQKIVFAYFERMRGSRATMLPDPLAAAYLVEPGIVRTARRMGLRMELAPGELRGASVPDEAGAPVNVLLDVDKSAFMNVLSRIVALKR